MGNIVVRLDNKGRIVIPKKVREKLGIEGESYVEVKVEENKIVLEPVKSIADKYFGVFKTEKWPEDLDEFLVKEEARRWLKDT